MFDIDDWGLPEEMEAANGVPQLLESVFVKAVSAKRILESFLEVTDDFIYIKDRDHKFVYTSNSFAQLTGHNSWKEIVGKTDFDLFPKEHSEVYFLFEKQVLETGTKLSGHEEPYVRLDGSPGWVMTNKNPVFGSSGNVVGLVGISKDITDIKEQQHKIMELANIDELSGLFNRRALFQQGVLLLDKALTEQNGFALLYIDLDRFKSVNDNHGHQAGDEVLRFFSRSLRDICNHAGIISRIGGDEFVVCLVGGDLIHQEAQDLASQIQAIEGSPSLRGCGCSIGIAFSPPQANLNELLLHADRQMYEVKQAKKQFLLDSPTLV